MKKINKTRKKVDELSCVNDYQAYTCSLKGENGIIFIEEMSEHLLELILH